MDNSKDHYIGEYIGDKPNGYGKKIYLSGTSYQGIFKDGKPNGKGIMIYKSYTRRYEGKLKRIYIGKWKNGWRNGNGVSLYFNDKKEVTKISSDIWINGKKNKNVFIMKM